MPRSMRRVLGILDSIVILLGVVFFAWGALDAIVWLLASGVGAPSANPTYLLDQRLQDRLASQSMVWIPAGVLLILGGVALWSFLASAERERTEGKRPSRTARIVPAALFVGLILLLLSAAVNAVPLPRRDITFADGDFPMGGTDGTVAFRVSWPFTATAGEILTGTLREVVTDSMTGAQYGPIVRNSTAHPVLDRDPLTIGIFAMPQAVSWEFPVPEDWTFVVVVGDVGACPPSLACPENYTTQISGHVAATGPAPYPLEGFLLYLPGLVLAVPPTVFWRIRFGKASERPTR